MNPNFYVRLHRCGSHHDLRLPCPNDRSSADSRLDDQAPTCALCGRPMQGHHPRSCDVAALKAHWAARSAGR